MCKHVEQLDKGLASRGKPSSGERSFVGFVKNNVSIEKETMVMSQVSLNVFGMIVMLT